MIVARKPDQQRVVVDEVGEVGVVETLKDVVHDESSTRGEPAGKVLVKGARDRERPTA